MRIAELADPAADDTAMIGAAPALLGAVRSGTFRGTADQVGAVREFVRAEFPDHPALDDAVLVASELAANSVVHSMSGLPGGAFIVDLANVSDGHIAVLITEQRSAEIPAAREAGVEAESGRGLAAVISLTSEFSVYDSGPMCKMLAIVPANPESLPLPQVLAGALCLRTAPHESAL
jgi:serine/threonine-protein kinase RsbW